VAAGTAVLIDRDVMTAADALIEMSDVAATARSKFDLFCTGCSLNRKRIDIFNQFD